MIRKNGNYTILSAFPIPNEEYEVVLARHDSFNSWVTWQYSIRNDSYFWGHYYQEYISALRDFVKRINDEIEANIELGIIK